MYAKQKIISGLIEKISMLISIRLYLLQINIIRYIARTKALYIHSDYCFALYKHRNNKQN